VEQGLGQAEPLLHSLREPANGRIDLAGELGQLEHRSGADRALASRHPVERAEVIQVVTDAERVVAAEGVGHEPDRAPHLGDVDGGVATLDEHPALVWSRQRRQHLEGGGLAGAIRPHQAVDLAIRDLEIDAVDGDGVAVALAQPLDPDHR
jgi:hypothetical protein